MRTFAISILAAMLATTAAGAAQFRATDVFAPGGGLIAQPGKPGPGTSLPVSPVGGGTLAPLSADECKGLGGSVVTSSYCNSGRSCQRTDENGSAHEVCLSAR